MRFGLVASSFPARDIVQGGILAERYSFDSLWIPDHFTDLYPTGDRVDPWTVLSAIGAQTKKLKLATVVTDTQRTHPARTAHIVATLDELSSGRAFLGIGAGEAMNTIPYGLPFESVEDRVDRLTEAIRVIRLLWGSSRDHRVSFDGRFFSLKDAVLDQRPMTSPPPVYVGALGARKMLKLVGELGDGWIPWTNSVETFARRSAEIKQAADAAGRKPGSIEMANVTSVALTEDSAVQRKAMDSMKSELLITLHRKVLKDLGFEPDVPRGFDYTYQRVVANEAVGDRAGEIAKSIPDELVRKFLVIGNTNEVIEGLARFVKAGVQHIVVKDVVGMSVFVKLSETEKTLKAFHSKVIPALK
ncbi:MAG: LLM class flavin-dependent oxidoreductase [Thaumarchaeota archaeon]|nr:LLM class flavin-dependent oxidoreductase [Nitrososphaerota archaeon]